MRLVLYGREPPEWYMKAVPELFGPIRAGPLPIRQPDGARPAMLGRAHPSTPLTHSRRAFHALLFAADIAAARAALEVQAPPRVFPPGLGGHWIHVVPLKELRELTVSWEVDDDLCDRRSPAALLASIGAAGGRWVPPSAYGGSP